MSDENFGKGTGSSDGFDHFEAVQRRVREERRQKHRPPDKLPIRPNVEYYRKTAKDELRSRQGSEPELGVQLVQMQIAKRLGFASWPELVSAIENRNAAAQAFESALARNDLDAARALASENLEAALDVAATSAPDRFGLIFSLLQRLFPKRDVTTLLLNALVEHHTPDGMYDCVVQLMQYSPDGDYAMDVLHFRLSELEVRPGTERDIEAIDEVMSQVAWLIDDSEFDYLSDGD